MKHPHAKSFIAVLSFAFVAAFLNPVLAQRDALSGGSSSTGTAATTVTKKIVATNDGLTVDIKQGSISYQFFATAADGSTSLVKSGTLAEPANKLSTNDLSLSKPGSKEITLVLTTSCDGCASVSLVPDASSPSAVATTKEIIAQKPVASIDIKANTSVDYELWTKATPFDSFVKDEKQSGTAAAPKDLNLLDDIVIGDPDAYEIKVVVKSPQGDASTSVSFRDKF